MRVKVKCPDGEIRTPKECLEVNKSKEFLPHPILKKVVGRLVRKRKKKDKIKFGTTKLTTKCLRQSFYQLTEEQIMDLEKLWILSRGHAFHNHFDFKENEVFVNKKFDDFEVLGFVDGIDDNTLYELKTTGNIPSDKPKGHHALQAQAYYSMYPKRDKIEDIKIVYLSLNEIKPFKVPKRDITPWIESRGHQLTTALKTKTPPPPEKSWLCNYCVFKDMCEGKKVEKKEAAKRATNKIVKNKKENKKMENWKDLFNES